MNPLFAAMYAPAGRNSVAPEKLLRGLMLQVLYGVRIVSFNRFSTNLLGR